MTDRIERFLCIASRDRGHDFLRQCAELGIRPTLLTLDYLRDADWPREAIEDVVTMPAGLNRDQIQNTVAWMARGRNFNRIIALGQEDLETAAFLREHLRIPGMGTTTAAYHRDRLAMRVSVRESGFPVPEFCRVLNYDELRAWMERVPPPWLLKPRKEPSPAPARRIGCADEFWRVLDELGDMQSHFLLEQLVQGEIFHVESILSEHEVRFAVANRCAHQSIEGVYDGRIETARTVDRGSRDWLELIALNAGLAPSLGMVRGIAHVEFIRSRADGRHYFLQIAAGVAGGVAADLVHAASGVNLWREWAQLEASCLRGEAWLIPDSYEGYAGSVICTAQSVEPDATGFDSPEIVSHIQGEHRAGMIVRAQNPEQVAALLNAFGSGLTRRCQAATEHPHAA